MRAIDISDKYPQNASMEKIDLPISHNKVRRDYFHIELMLFAIIGIIHAIFLSVHIVKNSAGVDLRNRVVGSRLLIQGIDPYSFVWQTGMSERLLDPNFKYAASRITVPPTVLVCVSLISWLEYTDILKVWLGLEWLAVFVMVFLLSWSLRLNTRARTWLLVFVALFTHAPPWLLHVDRGQTYIFYALLFCGAFAFLYKSTMGIIVRKNYFFLSILCMIMLISVWPPAIFILIPLFFSINYFLYGLLTLITGLLFFLVPIYILIGSEVWQHYYLSMRRIYDVIHLNVVAPVSTPVYIEGMNMIKTYYNITYSNKFKVALTEMGIHFDQLFLFWGFIAIIVGVYLAKKLYRDKSPTRLFLCGYVIHVLVIMSFFQRTNFSYKAVQWFLPMVLSLWLCLNKKKWDLKYWLAFILILGGFLINFPERLFINNLNLFLSEFFLIIAMLLLLGSDSQNKLRL